MALAMTIAVCTYNRADLLRRALRTLIDSVDRCAIKCEVLVVDNNSSDGTPAVVEQFGGRVRRVREPQQGLSFARNRALAESRTELLLFTDDDVAVEVGWAEAYAAAMSGDPQAAFFGGRVLVEWPSGKPEWLIDEDLPLLSGVIVKYDLGPQVRRYLPADPLPFGASFGIRRGLSDRIGTFRTDLGVKGDVPGRGEESEYLERAVRAGAAGVYVGSAVCHHRADASRLRLAHLYRHGYQLGVAQVRRQRSAPGQGSRGRAALFAARGLLQQLKGRGDRARQCVINAGIQMGMRGTPDRG